MYSFNQSNTFMATLQKVVTLLGAVSLCHAVYALTPGSPSLSFTFEIEGESGIVQGTVTAPLNDNSWTALPADTRMDVRVVRSCYALSESNVAVVSFEGLAPGESRTFTDTATPAWQYGYQYTYNAFASIDGGEESYQGFGSMSPGISFSFAYGTVSSAAKVEDGAFSVDITAIVPDKTNEYPAKPIPVDMTALEFYRLPDGTLQSAELIGQIENPVKGESYTYTDRTPKDNSKNYYLVKAVTKFGMAQVQTEAFVGYDVPQAPYPVSGEFQSDGGYKITWTAPTKGENDGMLDPEQTYYNVYRAWGRGENDREQIATGLKTTEYVDYGTDMTQARAVMYLVESANNIGTGGSQATSYDYDVVIGPAANLPYIETFDGGSDHVWSFDNSSYYAKFYEASEAEYGDTKVKPAKGTGLVYVDYSYSWVSAGSTADMTSYKIDLSKAVCPALSFYVYMIPSGNVTVVAQYAADGEEFADLKTIKISECTEAGWQKFVLPLELTAEGTANAARIRFHTQTEGNGTAAIFDEISVIDYLPVGDLSVSYDSENCSATISWEDPSTEYAVVSAYEGFVDGASVGTVEMPWTYKAADYKTPVQLAVKAIYGEIEAPMSKPVTISVPRPAYTEFTIDEHLFLIVEGTAANIHSVIVKEYLGKKPLYKAPEMIKYDDVTYTVVGIGAKAYAGNTDIVSVNLGENIATIGEEAFAGCSSLMSISFGEGLESIGARAFEGCSALATVIFSNPSVPEVGEDAFKGVANPCVGKCPEGCAEAYAAVEGLAPIDFGTSGINGIEASTAASVEYYDLRGVRIENPLEGTFVIVRSVDNKGTVTVKRTVFGR